MQFNSAFPITINSIFIMQIFIIVCINMNLNITTCLPWAWWTIWSYLIIREFYSSIFMLLSFIYNIISYFNHYNSGSYELLCTGTLSMAFSDFRICCCKSLYCQSFSYKLYISDTHSFIIFLRDSGEMTSIMAPALNNLIIKSNVGARYNSKSAYSPLSSINFWLWCRGREDKYGIWSR